MNHYTSPCTISLLIFLSRNRHDDEIESVTTSNSSTGFIVVQDTDSADEVDTIIDEQALSSASDNNNTRSSNVTFSESITTISLVEEKPSSEDDLTPSSSTLAAGGDQPSRLTTSPTSATSKQEEVSTTTPGARYSTFVEDQNDGEQVVDTPNGQQKRDPAAHGGISNTGGTNKGNTLFNRVASSYDNNGASNATAVSSETGQNVPRATATSLFALDNDGSTGTKPPTASVPKNDIGGTSTTTSSKIGNAVPPYSFATFKLSKGNHQDKKKPFSVGGGSQPTTQATGGNPFSAGGANDGGCNNAASRSDNDDRHDELYLKVHYYSKGGNRANNRPTISTSYGVSSTAGLDATLEGISSLFGSATAPLGRGHSTTSGTSSSFNYPATSLGGGSRFVRYSDASDPCLPHYIINDGFGEICTDCGKTNFTSSGSPANTASTSAAARTGTSSTTSLKKAKKSTPQSTTTTSRTSSKKSSSSASSSRQRAANEEYDKVRYVKRKTAALCIDKHGA